MNTKHRVTCPQCHATKVADERFLGHRVKCPRCGNTFLVPLEAPEVNVEQQPLPPPVKPKGEPPPLPKREPTPDSKPEMSDTKECPFCKEIVKVDAVKCKHCGEFFANDPRTRSPNPNIAAILNLVIPGTGYMYIGKFAEGMLYFIFIPFLYMSMIFCTGITREIVGAEGPFVGLIVVLFMIGLPIFVHIHSVWEVAKPDP